MDRDWITLRWPNQRFMDGIETFLNFARDHLLGKANISCPCVECENQRMPVSYDDVKYHLIKYGMKATYKVWHLHGERATPEGIKRAPTFQHHHQNELEMDMDLLSSVIQDLGNNLDAVVHDEPNVMSEGGVTMEDDAATEFASNAREAKTPLYHGCKDFTVLSFVVKLFNLKVNHGWSEKSFTELLQLLQKVLPSSNKTPASTYHAKKIITNLGLDYKMIHACPNDCILYWREHESKTSCPTCGASRWKIECSYKSSGTRVPAKVLRYFPLTPRIQRMYSVPWVAENMSWHATGKMQPGKMRHPVDSITWKAIDNKYKDFANEPRNVRLGFGTDGFNPFGIKSTNYSCWPVICVIYNLPPAICMKRQFMMLTLLIPGPRQPGKDIDVYLQPLVAELQDLWHKGFRIYDSFNNNTFIMRAILLWFIHDFPAYGNVSGCRTKGKYACPCCGPETDSTRLRHGKKNVYMGHRRWLPFTDNLSRKDTRGSTFNKKEELRRQPLRLSGTEVEGMVANLNVPWGKTKKKKQKGVEDGEENNDEGSPCFFKRSILFDLEYWKFHPVRHNLDVMHIEKNVCENIIALMLNTKGKTKDDVNARRDLKHLRIKERLWLKKHNGKVIQRPGRYWLRKEEKKLFLQTLRELRVPFGFSSNWRNIVTDDNMDLKCMKSHDYHVLMQHLLPMLIQHAFKDRKEIRPIIRSLCTFFNALCSRIVDLDTLMTLERGMAKTLCELEKACPPSLFVVMMHLPIHLAYEARICGPVFYRWMYPFERLMKTFKGYVSNKARPEGCIAERYIQEETLMYCTEYKGKGNQSILQVLDKTLDGTTPLLPNLIDHIDDNETGDESGPVSPGQCFVIEGIEYEQARRWVLNSHPDCDMWQRKHADFLQRRKVAAGKKSGHYKIKSEEEFIPWLKQQLKINNSNDIEFVDIVRGPKAFATRYNKYCVNGFLFVTKDHEASKKCQNSGVSTNCMTTFRASAKDKRPMNESAMYYGVLRDIIQLEYRDGYKPVLFKCDWVKLAHGVKVDEEAKLRLVNLFDLIRSDQVGDEPFILAEQAMQIFYSKDPNNPEWHVVLEVPTKIYIEDETGLLSEQPVITDADVGPCSSEPILDDELIFNDLEDIDVVIEKTNKRKRAKKY